MLNSVLVFRFSEKSLSKTTNTIASSSILHKIAFHCILIFQGKKALHFDTTQYFITSKSGVGQVRCNLRRKIVFFEALECTWVQNVWLFYTLDQGRVTSVSFVSLFVPSFNSVDHCCQLPVRCWKILLHQIRYCFKYQTSQVGTVAKASEFITVSWKVSTTWSNTT